MFALVYVFFKQFDAFFERFGEPGILPAYQARNSKKRDRNNEKRGDKLNGITLGNTMLLLFNGAKTGFQGENALHLKIGFHGFISVVGDHLIIKKIFPFVKKFVTQKISG